MKRRWFLAGLALPLVSAGCRGANRGDAALSGPESPVAEGQLVKVSRNNKTLVMATTANYPPYQQRLEGEEEVPVGEAVGDSVVGFDIDLAKLIAERLERKLEVVDLEFGALLPAVINEEVDMAMAALEPNRSRKQRVDFSNIYYRSQHALVSLDGYLRSRDLAYQTIGIRANSVEARFADALTQDIPDLDLVPYENLDEVFEALDIGAVEGAIVEANIASQYLRRYPEFAGKIIPSERATGSAIALKKDSPLLSQINSALLDIKSSGDIDKVITDWFS